MMVVFPVVIHTDLWFWVFIGIAAIALVGLECWVRKEERDMKGANFDRKIERWHSGME
jgi:hypothetical protein